VQIDRALLGTRAGRIAAGCVAVLTLAVVIALAVMWPGATATDELGRLLQPETEHGQVTGTRKVECLNARFADCRRLEVKVLTGETAGTKLKFLVGEEGFVPKLDTGDRVSLLRQRADFEQGESARRPFSLGNPERRRPLVVFAVLFVFVVLALGRRKGALALAGLGIGLGIIFVFLLPAILEGTAPVPAALAGGLAVMLSATLLAHGLTAKSLAAILGTAVALALTAALAVAATEAASLTGFVSADSSLLRFATRGELSLEGLVLASILIGTLGVLDDVTVSQASAVMALRRANPALGARALYDRALEIGRDHVSAAVNTLVLAYVGASLPILLVFGVGGVGVLDILDREDVAEQVVATLVGSIGLMAAVPLATGAAAVLASRLPPDAVAAGDGAHGHAH
jgi:uncharacterized membrane protein